MDNPIDSETQQVLTEGQMMENYVLSDGWRYAKDEFTKEIMDLQSILNLSGTTPENIAKEIQARTLAIDILMRIIKKVEGRGEQHRGNKTLTLPPENDFVTNLDA